MPRTDEKRQKTQGTASMGSFAVAKSDAVLQLARTLADRFGDELGAFDESATPAEKEMRLLLFKGKTTGKAPGKAASVYFLAECSSRSGKAGATDSSHRYGHPVVDLCTLFQRALKKALLAKTPNSRALRECVAEALGAADREAGGNARRIVAEKMLTTEEAATVLGFSRPYVAMLCDRGILKGATRSDGGHRRIPRDAVDAYKAEVEAGRTSAQSPREAGVAAGLYRISERTYIEAARKRSARPSQRTRHRNPRGEVVR